MGFDVSFVERCIVSTNVVRVWMAFRDGTEIFPSGPIGFKVPCATAAAADDIILDNTALVWSFLVLLPYFNKHLLL